MQQNGVDALRLSVLEDVSAWDFVLPPAAKQDPQTSHVEGIELFAVPAVDSPCLACIEQGRENNYPVDFQFGFQPQAWPSQTWSFSLPKAALALANLWATSSSMLIERNRVLPR